jgi:hypothetical protein
MKASREPACKIKMSKYPTKDAAWVHHRVVLFVIHGVTGVCYGVSGTLYRCAGKYSRSLKVCVFMLNPVVFHTNSVTPEGLFRRIQAEIKENESGKSI